MLIVALSRRVGYSCAIVEVDGELDAFNCRLLADTLAQAVDAGAVVVDLNAARHFPAAALHCLEHAASVLYDRGRELHLVCADDVPAQVALRAAGMQRRWPIHPDIDTAVQQHASARHEVVWPAIGRR